MFSHLWTCLTTAAHRCGTVSPRLPSCNWHHSATAPASCESPAEGQRYWCARTMVQGWVETLVFSGNFGHRNSEFGTFFFVIKGNKYSLPSWNIAPKKASKMLIPWVFVHWFSTGYVLFFSWWVRNQTTDQPWGCERRFQMVLVDDRMLQSEGQFFWFLICVSLTKHLQIMKTYLGPSWSLIILCIKDLV